VIESSSPHFPEMMIFSLPGDLIPIKGYNAQFSDADGRLFILQKVR